MLNAHPVNLAFARSRTVARAVSGLRSRLVAAVATLLVVGLSLAASPAARAADGRPFMREVAKAYGLDSFYKVEKIVFSFNVSKGETLTTRTWIWRPQSTELTYIGMNDQGALVRSSYFRADLSPDSPPFHNQVEQWFVNDSYWLLFPLMVAWDDKVKVDDQGMAPMPLGGGDARHLVVTYPATGGFTPGDVYEVFVGADKRIHQWIFRKGGSPTPTVVTTWDEHTKMGPLLLSLSHQSGDGAFKLWFGNVVLTSREDADSDTPSLSEFTAVRFQAESQVALEMRARLQTEEKRHVAELSAKQAAEAAAKREATAREAATLAAKREADARAASAAELAAKREADARAAAAVAVANNVPQVPATPKTPTVPSVPATPATPATPTVPAVAAPSAKELAAARKKAEQEARELAAASKKAEENAKREAEARVKADRAAAAETARVEAARRKEAELAAAKTAARIATPEPVRTVKPSKSSSSTALANGLDSEVDPDITLAKVGIVAQGIRVSEADLSSYLQSVAKRDHNAPVTIRLDSHYDNTTYINLMNQLRDLKLKNLVVTRGR